LDERDRIPVKKKLLKKLLFVGYVLVATLILLEIGVRGDGKAI
jgi:hypothetical protein